jgi:hypothetical protein
MFSSSILNSSGLFVSSYFDYIVLSAPHFVIYTLIWIYTPSMRWPVFMAISFGGQFMAGLIPPSIPLTWDRKKSFKDNYIFAMKAYFFVVVFAIFVGYSIFIAFIA